MGQPCFIFVFRNDLSSNRIIVNDVIMNKKHLLRQILDDKALGCLVGGAVGDALGYAVEFEQWPYIRNTYGDKGITRYELAPNGKALISDDTQMSLFTAAGILLGQTRGFMRGIAGRIDTYCTNTYIDWLHTQEWQNPQENAQRYTWLMDVPELYARRAPGNTCLSALRSLERCDEVKNNSCGCGGVMRTAPLAVFEYIHDYAGADLEHCAMTAAEAARITHKHPLGFLPSAVLSLILMMLMEQDEVLPWLLTDVVESALEMLPSIKSEEDYDKTYGELWPREVEILEKTIKKALSLTSSDIPDHVAIERIGGGWTGHEALAIAIYSAVKHWQSFEDAIVSSVNHSGDSDSTGAICGNIMGTYRGRADIPECYTKNLELIDVIEEMSEDLFTGCIIREYMDRDTLETQRWFEKYCQFRWTPKTNA